MHQALFSPFFRSQSLSDHPRTLRFAWGLIHLSPPASPVLQRTRIYLMRHKEGLSLASSSLKASCDQGCHCFSVQPVTQNVVDVGYRNVVFFFHSFKGGTI